MPNHPQGQELLKRDRGAAESPQTKAWSVRLSLTLLVGGSVLPIIVMVTFVILTYYQREQAQVSEGAISRARAASSAIDRDFGSAQAALLALATSPLLAKDGLAGFHAQALIALANLNAENVVPLERMLKTGKPGVSDLFGGRWPVN